MAATHTGGCACGAVAVAVTGRPQAMGICHCESCRTWYSQPINAFMIWKPDSVSITNGVEHVGTFNKHGNNERSFCRECGGRVMGRLVNFGLMVVHAGAVPSFPFVPSMHVNYGEKTLAIPDGLPKFKDFPKAFGGSDEMVAE